MLETQVVEACYVFFPVFSVFYFGMFSRLDVNEAANKSFGDVTCSLKFQLIRSSIEIAKKSTEPH